MLDRSADPDRDIQLRCNDLARLSDLLAVVRVPTVDSSTGSSNTGPESVGEREDDGIEVFLGLDAATA